MNSLADRLLHARVNREIINYYIEYRCIKLVNPKRRANGGECIETIYNVSVERMRQAVNAAGLDVAANVLTIWS